MARQRRVKLSVTVDSQLIQMVDAFLSGQPELDRSKVMDEALALWCEREQARAMEGQFATRSPAEDSERAEWSRIQRAAAQRVFGPH